MAFIRNLIGVVEEICDHPHELTTTVNTFLDAHAGRHLVPPHRTFSLMDSEPPGRTRPV